MLPDVPSSAPAVTAAGKGRSPTSSLPPAGWAAPLCLDLQPPLVNAAGLTWPPSLLHTGADRVRDKDRLHPVINRLCTMHMQTTWLRGKHSPSFHGSEWAWCAAAGVWPGRVPSSARAAPAARLPRGSLPSPPRTSPGLSLPAAARCAAASPSGPPAAPWSRRSFGHSEPTSLPAGKIIFVFVFFSLHVYNIYNRLWIKLLWKDRKKTTVVIPQQITCSWTEEQEEPHQSSSAGFATEGGVGGAERAHGGRARAPLEKRPPLWRLGLGGGGAGEANTRHLVDRSEQAIPGHALEVPESKTAPLA